MAEHAQTPIILFGACDRHNFGDLLFPHIAARMLAPLPVVVAGLAERDLTASGGHRVAAIGRLARELRARPARLIHVGGELLTCTLYEAAIMTLPPDEAAAAIARHDSDAAGRSAWAAGLLGLSQDPAYLVPRGLFRHTTFIAYQSVGGAGLPALPAALRDSALGRLREADRVCVRDRMTRHVLDAAGIQTEMAPDSAALAAALFRERIARHAGQGEPAAMQRQFSQGYAAVQFSADYGDDATLATLARQLDAIRRDTGLGIVLFRAGTAPWHDDLETYRRLGHFMRPPAPRLFASADIWDICALLAGARVYLGSSLHGRIVSTSLAIPGVTLVSMPAETLSGKQAAYLSTWHAGEDAGLALPATLAEAAVQALARPARQRADHARGLAELAARSWQTLASQASL